MTEPSRKRLPVLSANAIGSIDPTDGRRRLPVPADVRGRFATARKVVFALLVAFWVAAPLARVGGRPLVLLDVEHRRFFLFGEGFGVEDVHLLFFALTGVGFALVVATALLGRVWCGWACPQTVFLEGVFRPIERFFEGSREARLKRDRSGWTLERAARKAGKHVLFLVMATLIAHASMSLFVSWPGLLSMVSGAPSLHPQAFVWAVVLTAILYVDFAFFREQLCLVICPYGRLQGVLVDRATLVVGYDERRGEPRGKASDPEAGACVDCNRCVAVCPTGIDIRKGNQLDCIGCTACIDACDEVMDKLERPRGLVRYDSQQGLDGEKRQILRPRIAIYAVLGVIGLVVATTAIWRRDAFSGQVLRAPGAPFVIDAGRIRNSFLLQLASRHDTTTEVELSGEGAGLEFSFPERVVVEPMHHQRVPFVVTAEQSQVSTPFVVVVRERVAPGAPEAKVRRIPGRFVAPGGGAR